MPHNIIRLWDLEISFLRLRMDYAAGVVGDEGYFWLSGIIYKLKKELQDD